MELNQQQHSNYSEFWDRLLELAPDERAQVLAQISDTSGLKTLLLRALASAQNLTTGNFVTTVSAEGADRQIPNWSGLSGMVRMGPYKLLRELGQGGMGVVFVAEKADGQPKRQVALKVPKLDFSPRQFLERFDREREILASLNHPHIAGLYDAGVSDGKPFLVLEYVDGQPITTYSDKEALSVELRIRLFLQVLAALQYAHSRLVIHRDLKPGNIFVNREGEAKLLDFGTAKLLGRNEDSKDATIHGSYALTPGYASPEQLQGQAVTTSTDIFSLGVVLFELLSGKRPFENSRSLERIYPAGGISLRTIHVDERCALSRSTTVKRLRRLLRGDLEAVVAKAMHSVQQERYVTADALAQDLERYLSGKPVHAAPRALSYRTRKFAARHKLAVASALSVSMAILVALAVTLWALQQARSETHRSEASERFLEDLFLANSQEGADPVKARQTTARELLDIAAGKIDSELKGEPKAKLAVLNTLRRIYGELGLDDQAVTLSEKAVLLSKSLSGESSPQTAAALLDLAEVLHASRAVNRRIAVLAEAKRILDFRRDNTSRTRALLDMKLAEHYQSSDLDKADTYAAEAVRLYRLGRVTDELSWALYQHAIISQSKGRTELAGEFMSEAIAVSIRVKGKVNSDLPRLYAYEGEYRQSLLDFRGAEQSLRAALSLAQRINGPDHVDSIETELRLGDFLFYSSRPSEGLEHLKAAKDRALRVKGASDPFYVPKTNLEYGWALVNRGSIEEGLPYVEQAIATRRRTRPGTLYLAQMLTNQAGAQLELGFFRQAEAALDEAAAIEAKSGAPVTALECDVRAKIFAAEGRSAEGADAFQRFGRMQPRTKGESMSSLRAQQYQADAALLQGTFEKSAALAAALVRQTQSPAFGPYLQNAQARAALTAGRSYLLLRRPEQALPLLQLTTELRSKLLEPNSPALADSELALAECYLQVHNRKAAQVFLTRAREICLHHRRIGKQYADSLRRVSEQFANTALP